MLEEYVRIFEQCFIHCAIPHVEKAWAVEAGTQTTTERAGNILHITEHHEDEMVGAQQKVREIGTRQCHFHDTFSARPDNTRCGSYPMHAITAAESH